MSENTNLTFRKLLPDDHEEFASHLRRLDAASRRLRFGMLASDAFVADYAERCAKLSATVHGAFERNRLIGAAELRPLGPLFPGEAEIAFSVEQDWRNQGIGTELFARVIRSARNRALYRLYMSCLTENVPMQALARKFQAEMTLATGDLIAMVTPPRRTIISLLGEALDTRAALPIMQRKIRPDEAGARPHA